MPKPRTSANRAGSMNTDLFGALAQALGVAFNPGQQDGLRRLAVNNRYGNPNGLQGLDLVKYWSSLDANTPDKMDIGRVRDLYRQFPNSPYAKQVGGDLSNVANPFMNAYFSGGGYGQY